MIKLSKREAELLGILLEVDLESRLTISDMGKDAPKVLAKLGKRIRRQTKRSLKDVQEELIAKAKKINIIEVKKKISKLPFEDGRRGICLGTIKQICLGRGEIYLDDLAARFKKYGLQLLRPHSEKVWVWEHEHLENRQR